MDLSFEFRNNFVFRCAVFFVVLKYVIGLIRVDFDSNNQMGEGDTPKRPMIVSTVGTNLELFWLFFPVQAFVTIISVRTFKHIGDRRTDW